MGRSKETVTRGGSWEAWGDTIAPDQVEQRPHREVWSKGKMKVISNGNMTGMIKDTSI